MVRVLIKNPRAYAPQSHRVKTLNQSAKSPSNSDQGEFRMQEQQAASNTQLNLGTHQRNAARDYYELLMPGSIELMLTATPQSELDALTEDNPRLFRRRFGFKATQAVRKQVIALQQTYEFDDSDIRWLKHSGHLQVFRKEVRMQPSILMPICGWIQLIIFSLVYLSVVVQIMLSTAPEWKQGLGLLGATIFWFAGAGVSRKLYLQPWNILKRSGAMQASKLYM